MSYLLYRFHAIARDVDVHLTLYLYYIINFSKNQAFRSAESSPALPLGSAFRAVQDTVHESYKSFNNPHSVGAARYFVFMRIAMLSDETDESDLVFQVPVFLGRQQSVCENAKSLHESHLIRTVLVYENSSSVTQEALQ